MRNDAALILVCIAMRAISKRSASSNSDLIEASRWAFSAGVSASSRFGSSFNRWTSLHCVFGDPSLCHELGPAGVGVCE
jgi:hypothetical protein